MADKQVNALTSSTPTIDDLTVSFDNADTSELKQTTWQAVRTLFKSYFDTIYQAILVSGTNIKTVNGNSILGSGDITISGGGSSTFLGLTDTPSSYSGQALKVVQVNAGATGLEFVTASGGGDALVANPLSQFASTTSLQLKGVISDETGSGALVFGTSPNITTPTGIIKSDVGLGNVDNTSDATKNSATATLTNKTLTSPVINVSSDATGDIYYRNSGGLFTRLPVGSNGKVLTIASGIPSWATPSAGSGGKYKFAISGAIGATGTNVANTIVIDGSKTLTSCNVWYGTAGSGTLTIDINKNGTTLFSATKPSITTTNQYSINSGTLTTTSLVSGDVLTLDIDAVPGTVGIDLYVELNYN